MLAEKYINPFTDFGFKRIFGEEANKDLLIDFLNEILKDKGTIINITYLKSEHLGLTELDRKAIFDLYCENEKGEKFIVEMQCAKQDYFKDRSLYYATFPIQEQAPKGAWNYKLNAIYSIAIMDFVFEDSKMYKTKIVHDVRLIEKETQKEFYDKLRLIFIEIQKFDKELEDIETHFEKWLYVLKNLSKLDEIPKKLQDKIFKKLFKVAEIAHYNHKELLAYRDSEKHYYDFIASLQTSFREGKEEGIEQGKQMGIEQGKQIGEEKKLKELIINAHQTGLTSEQISQITLMPITEIERIIAAYR